MNITMNINERSAAIDLISEINAVTSSTDLLIKKAGGENTISNFRNSPGEVAEETTVEYLGNTKRLTRSRIKTRKVMFPDVLIYADENKNQLLQGWEVKMPDVPVTDIEFIKDAQDKADKLRLNTAVLWNFKDVVLYEKKDGNWGIVKHWTDMSILQDRNAVNEKPHIWKSFLKKFLLELNSFHINGVIKHRELEEVSESVTTSLIAEQKNLLADFLHEKSKTDRGIQAFIAEWWSFSEKEFYQDEDDKFVAYSKNILLNWLTRFTFANVIMETHNSAKALLQVNESFSPIQVNQIFAEITAKSDFYTIFAPIFLNEHIPEQIWKLLIEYNSFLQDKTISQAVLQRILETTVKQYKREIIGQYTTPEKLAKLLVESTIVNADGHDIDPCSGTGTIPLEIMKLKRKLGLSELEIHEKTWASDKMDFPLQMSNMALTSSESINLVNKVFQKNVFTLKVDQNISFVSPESGELLNYKIPKFQNIVSNLPFVPFEIIDNNDQIFLSKVQQYIATSSNNKYSLDGRADYYQYVLIYLLSLLSDNGRIGVITSNSWLGTKSGRKFFNTLTYFCKIKTIIVSGNGRWFDNADVMSSIIIIEKKQEFKIDTSEQIQFTSINKKLIDCSNTEIESIANNVIIGKFNKLMNGNTYTVDDIQKMLSRNISLNALFYDVSWIDGLEDKLIPISDKLDVFRGMRRGWDAMFYPESGHNIEKDYIKRVLKTSRSVLRYNATTDSDAFSCSKSLEELENLGHTGALNWIAKFENGVNGTGKPLKEVLSSRNTLWYEMKSQGSMADYITSLNPGSRLFWAKFDEPAFINQRLIGLKMKDENIDKELVHALLNSILGIFFIEASGFGRGLGALDLSKDNVKNIMMLNPDLLNNEQSELIKVKFKKLFDKDIENLLDSLSNPERDEFDFEVLKAFGIEDRHTVIKKTLKNMISARLSV